VSASPDSVALDAFLARVSRRLVVLRVVEGATAGLLAGVLVWLVLRPALPVVGVAIALAAAAAAVRALLGDRFTPGWWRRRPLLADRVEQSAPECRNVLVTAAELAEDSTRSTPPIRARIFADAAAIARALDPRALFPARRQIASLALVTGLVGLAAWWSGLTRGAGAPESTSSRTSIPAASIQEIQVVIVPPSYTGRPEQRLIDPARVDAMAGSRVRLLVRGNAARMNLEMAAGIRPLERTGEDWSAEFGAGLDDYLAIHAMADSGGTDARRLVALSVAPDQAPRVRVTVPGRDLFFTTVPESLPIVVEAADDIGLASIRVRYTAVTGSGEQFTFTEQDVPLSVTRTDARQWSARGTWAVGRLRLTPGDMLVYHAVAVDNRPAAPASTSESFVLEMVAPGAIAAEGFAADDERDRYAVSQQMVILKTERLIAARGTMPTDSVSAAARTLAAEQRRVRAEFVFMMGGELEEADDSLAGTLLVDEAAEAEAEDDVLAGRLQNRGRIEMQRALRAMSRAASALVEANLPRALADERVALDNLMRALSRSRFLLRALTQREQLDLERRLTGTLTGAGPERRPPGDAPADPRTAAIRRILVELAALSASPAFDDSSRSRLAAAAVSILRVDPSDDTLRAISARVELNAARIGRVSAGSIRPDLESVVLQLGDLLRASLPVAPTRNASIEEAAFRGRFVDAMRGRGGGSP
jgi:hypothetical protein